MEALEQMDWVKVRDSVSALAFALRCDGHEACHGKSIVYVG